MGSNNLNTDCSCHAPSVIYNQAVLSCSVTTTETLVGRNLFFNRHGETGAASDDSVSTNHSIKILL